MIFSRRHGPRSRPRQSDLLFTACIVLFVFAVLAILAAMDNNWIPTDWWKP